MFHAIAIASSHHRLFLRIRSLPENIVCRYEHSFTILYVVAFISSPELKAQVFRWTSLSLSWTFHIFIFFARTTRPILTKLGTKHPWVKGIQIVYMKGPVLFWGEIITQYGKYIDEIKQSSPPEHRANFNQTWHNASLVVGDSNLFKCQMKGLTLFQGKIITNSEITLTKF